MYDYRETLSYITDETKLSPSEQILLHQYIIAGHKVLCAGVSTWKLVGKTLTRVTRQLEGHNLSLILDDSDLYQELMADLSCYTDMLLSDGNKPEDFDRCIYVFTQDGLSQEHPKLHMFSRMS